MGAENVEIARHLLEGLGRQTPDALPGWIERFWERNGDYYPVAKFPRARPCHGHDELAAFLIEFGESYHPFHFQPEELFAVGDERVLARVLLSGTGRESGVPLEGLFHPCFWLRGGRVFRQEDHMTEAGARGAFGLDAETAATAPLSDEGQALCAAWNVLGRDGPEGVRAWIERYCDEEADPVRTWPEARPYHGREEWTTLMSGIATGGSTGRTTTSRRKARSALSDSPDAPYPTGSLGNPTLAWR